MRLGTQTGSLINHVMATAKQPEPQVGMGATILMWSDRKAATVVEVKGRILTVQEDRAIVTAGSLADGSAQYRYEPNPAGARTEFRLDKHGNWKGRRGNGDRLLLGRREKYHDPSF